MSHLPLALGPRWRVRTSPPPPDPHPGRGLSVFRSRSERRSGPSPPKPALPALSRKKGGGCRARKFTACARPPVGVLAGARAAAALLRQRWPDGPALPLPTTHPIRRSRGGGVRRALPRRRRGGLFPFRPLRPSVALRCFHRLTGRRGCSAPPSPPPTGGRGRGVGGPVAYTAWVGG